MRMPLLAGCGILSFYEKNTKEDMKKAREAKVLGWHAGFTIQEEAAAVYEASGSTMSSFKRSKLLKKKEIGRRYGGG